MKSINELKREFEKRIISSNDDFWFFEPSKVESLRQLSLKIFRVSKGKSRLSYKVQRKLAASLWKTLDLCFGEALPLAFLRKDYLFLSWLIEKNIVHLIWLLATLNGSHLQDEEWKLGWLSRLSIGIKELQTRVEISLVDSDLRHRITCILGLLKETYHLCIRALGEENFKVDGLKNFETRIDKIQKKASLEVHKKWPKIMEEYEQFYSKIPWITALAVWGSIGHGNVDSFSEDVDIYGFTKEKPTQKFMEEAIRVLGDGSSGNRIERNLAYSIIEGIETHIDFVHPQEIEFKIAKLVGKKAVKPPWSRSVSLDELQDTIVWYDPTGWLKEQKQKLLEVSRATQNRRLEMTKRRYKDNLAKVEYALNTKSLFYFQEALTSACRDVIEAMFILNDRHYYFGWWKWLTPLVKELDMKPESALERLLNIYCNLSGWTLQERYTQLKVLAKEVYAMNGTCSREWSN